MFFTRRICRISLGLAFFLLGAGSLPSFAQRGATGVVVSDSELATEVGMRILRQGGNAVDAAVATAFALGVVDPASSGIGGGGFMVIYQGREKKAHVLDFREKAPGAAHKNMYLKGGKVVPELSLTGPLAVAVPGEVAGLTDALKRFGTLPLTTVMAPAIQYAAEGFPLRPVLRSAVERHLSTIAKSPHLARLFLKADGTPRDEGEIIRQPELSTSLKAIAQGGAEVFYQGWIAQAVVNHLRKEGGIMTLEDLKGYRTAWREPIIGKYRRWLVITMPPPSSGGVALMEMLNVLESYHLSLIPHNSPTYLHLLAETMKHAFADRAQYLGDPDFAPVPVQKLISKGYAAQLRHQISPVYTRPQNSYGLASLKEEKGGTTHFAVLDRMGNAVSASLTINTLFGSKVVVPGTGIILNNEMDDFSVQPGAPNVYGLVGAEANSIQPKKRPLSSMTPTIILQEDRPVLIVGASGGPRIISAALQTILNALDFGMSLKDAIESPRIHHQWVPNELWVEGELSASTRRSLERRGHVIKERDSVGVVQAILVRRGKIGAEADPRKQGRGNKIP